MMSDFYTWCRTHLGAMLTTRNDPLSRNLSAEHRQLTEAATHIADLSDVPTLCQMLDDGNGYFRQLALARCVQLLDAELLPCVLQRLNDWVPQVREQAKTTLAHYLAQPDPAIAARFITLLPQIALLGRGQRADHAPSQSAIEQYLQQAVHWPLLQDALQGPDRICSRHCFRLLRDCHAMPMAELVQLGLGCKDIVVASMIFDCCSVLDTITRFDILRHLLASPFNTVRAKALRRLLQEARQHDEIDHAALAAQTGKVLFDHSALVRELTWQWYLTNRLDPHAPYRAIWNSSQPTAQQLRCAVWAAAKAQATDLVPNLRQQCEHLLPSVRGAARLACAQLAPDMAPELMQQALFDLAPAAKRHVQALYWHFKVPVPLTALMAMCQQRHYAERILAVLNVVEKWDALICLLCLTRQQNQPIQSMLEVAFVEWVRRDQSDYHAPQQAQRQQIASLLQDALSALQALGKTASHEVLRAWPEQLHFILKCNQLMP